MNVTSIHPPTFRDFDWKTPNETGIGGSETAVIEMAGRLASRGHDVIVYAPTVNPQEQVDPRGAKWLDCRSMKPEDFTRPGVWILNRCPEVLDQFPIEHPDQKLWLLSEDVWYQTMTPERGAKLDRYICLCESHAWTIRQHYPYLADKVCVGANGIKMELIREIEKDPPTRNPHKMIFASSPDRGLLPLLKIFRRARWWVKDLELHCFYGFNNIEEIIKQSGSACPQRVLRDEIMKEMDQPGVVWHGRATQPELYREWFSAGMWVTPSNFSETNCITAQEAQACGAIPIFKPVWAIGEYVQHGVSIHGDAYTDPLTQARYAGEIFRIASQPELQEKIRAEMMPFARSRFTWERSVDIMEAWMHDYSDHFGIFCQYQFTLKHAREYAHGKGRILNVGCGNDAPQLKEKYGAINFDVRDFDRCLQVPNPVDVLGDARLLPAPFEPHSFDCVICSEVLEHYAEGQVDQLIRLKKCLKPGGKLILTVPDETRDIPSYSPDGSTEYAPGIRYQHHFVPDDLFKSWLHAAGLKILVWQVIEYGWDDQRGRGVVCVPETCCEWDTDRDGNCHIHSAPGVLRRKAEYVVGVDPASGESSTVTVVAMVGSDGRVKSIIDDLSEIDRIIAEGETE
jgi:glycosyltransferase involved in cell wall biosynthesis